MLLIILPNNHFAIFDVIKSIFDKNSEMLGKSWKIIHINFQSILQASFENWSSHPLLYHGFLVVLMNLLSITTNEDKY